MQSRSRCRVFGYKTLPCQISALYIILKFLVSGEIDYFPGANVHFSVAEAETRAGVSFNYTGAEIGASLFEAQAGPFAIRAGLKFGVAVKEGVPEVHAGPVSTCLLM